jgi:CBS domain-containing protein
MQVRDGMSSLVLAVGPSHTLSEAARLMAVRKVGAAAVIDPDLPGPGIITERDILHALAAEEDPGKELVRDHLTDDLIVASPDWSLEQAARAMIEGNFRHLLVVSGGELSGVLSMRDIVRCWSQERAERVA